jgi:hypothetical protein
MMAAWRASWLALLVGVACGGCLASVDPSPHEGTSVAPVLTLQKDEQEDRFVVMAAGPFIPWATVAIQADRAGTRVTVGEVEDGAQSPVELVPTEARAPTSSSEDVVAGDSLDFCAVDNTNGPITYTMSETRTDSILYVGTFETVAVCD